MSRILTTDRFKVTVSSMPGPWHKASGREASREVPLVREEAGAAKKPLPGRLEFGDVTTSRLYDADRDSVLIKALGSGKTFADTTITVQELDADGLPITGAQVIHSGCVVKSFTAPDADADGADQSELVVVWTPSGIS